MRVFEVVPSSGTPSVSQTADAAGAGGSSAVTLGVNPTSNSITVAANITRVGLGAEDVDHTLVGVAVNSGGSGQVFVEPSYVANSTDPLVSSAGSTEWVQVAAEVQS